MDIGNLIFVNRGTRVLLCVVLGFVAFLMLASPVFMPGILGMSLLAYGLFKSTLTDIGFLTAAWFMLRFTFGNDYGRYFVECFFLASVPSVFAVAVFLPYANVALWLPLLAALAIAFGSGNALRVKFIASRKSNSFS